MNKNQNTPRNASREIDETVLDRLVDNELSREEYRHVLTLLEEKPEGWRKLALAFLESQALTRELDALQLYNEPAAGTGTEARNDDPAISVHIADTGNDDCPSPTRTHSALAQPSGPEPRRPFGFRSFIPAVAASVALVLVGFLYWHEIGGFRNQGSFKNGFGNSGNGNGTVVDPDYIELVSNHSDRIRTPVVNHQEFDPEKLAREMEQLKPSLQKVVSGSGWQADEQARVVPVQDKTGNRIIVPLSEIKLTRGNREEYQ